MNNNVKVADFGLTEDIYTKSYFRQDTSDTSVRLPLKWMALESIKLRMFSEKTDVVGKHHLCTHKHFPKSRIFPITPIQIPDLSTEDASIGEFSGEILNIGRLQLTHHTSQTRYILSACHHWVNARAIIAIATEI